LDNGFHQSGKLDAGRLNRKLDWRRRHRRRLRVVAPWLEDSDELTMKAYCQLVIEGAAIFAASKTMPITKTTSDGRDLEVRRLFDQHRQNLLAQLRYAEALGLTPATRKQLQTRGERSDLAAQFANLDDEVTDAEVVQRPADVETVDVTTTPKDRES
jgi:hypothetical protein